MNKPTLVVLAAGMGSRYGGLKQMDPVGNHGEFIIDYSIFDAVKAGFGKVVFIINRKLEESFKETIGARLAPYIEVAYAYQELDLLPEGVAIPENRKKPYGTAHALYAAGPVIDGPFAVINADDYYGRDAFEKMHDFLVASKPGDYGMVGYLLKNTVSDFGYVSRGVCHVQDGFLTSVEEKVRIEKVEDGIAYFEEEHWHDLDADTVVSMNMWGADRSLITYIEEQMKDKLTRGLKDNPEKFEYYLPFAIDEMLQNKLCSVQCMVTDEVWYGITYEADKAHVVGAIKDMIDSGKYPDKLWGTDHE